jgi:hypothetical protein
MVMPKRLPGSAQIRRLYAMFTRASVCAFKGKYRGFASTLLSLGTILFFGHYTAKMDGCCEPLHLIIAPRNRI